MNVVAWMMLVGCRSKIQEEIVDTGTDSWSQSEVTESDEEEQNTDSGKPDYEEDENDEDEKEDTGFEDKPEDEDEDGEGEGEGEGGNGSSDYTECGEDFDPNVPCQGDWTTTICTSDGLIWWCDNGVWLNEEDK
jgi:hypothetical protein